MENNEYQKLAMRTLNLELTDQKAMLLNAALGLEGETGEIADLVKKHLFQNHPLDTNKITKELGDTCWYFALLVTALDIQMDEFIQEIQFDTENLTLQGIVLGICRQASDIEWEIQAFLENKNYNFNVMSCAMWTFWIDILSLCTFLNLKITDVLEQNIAKLKARYPEGFLVENSLNRGDN